MVLMVIDMKVNKKMVNKKEKEFIIIRKNHGKMIDMKVNGEMVKKKEKEFIIIMMVIEKWVIIIMVCQKENLLCLLIMVKLK